MGTLVLLTGASSISLHDDKKGSIVIKHKPATTPNVRFALINGLYIIIVFLFSLNLLQK